MLLSHDPECFRQAAAKDVALTLAGHTHGGQIALPFLARWVSFSRLTHHFSLGLYRIGRSTLYVHPGLGTDRPADAARRGAGGGDPAAQGRETRGSPLGS